MDKANDLDVRLFWRESSFDSDFENSDNSLDGTPFRGFEKESKVLIEKFNISDILDEPDLNSKKFRRKSLNGTLKTLPQLVSSCSVRLVREDLQQLKKDVLDNSRLKKSKTNGILIMPLLYCKVCEKAYSTEKKLQNHTEKKHMLVYKAGITRKPQKRVSFCDNVIVHELKEYHRCRKCTKIFEKYKLLKNHMKHEHRKRKCYICNYCSKNFVDRMFFKVHIKHHCDVCGLLLLNKREYLMHRRDSCRVVKKYTCKTCENKFFSYMDLKDHSYDHFEDLFVCDICKAQHISKCGILHHILFLHSKKRPKELFTNRSLGNERLYLCNFCEVSSLDKDVIDRHVSVLDDLNNRKYTGYKDYYFCDQCLRKFETETSMLQHKWSHFLNTSENSQVRTKKRVGKNITPPESQTFKIDDKLLNVMQPRVVLERLCFDEPKTKLEVNNSNNLDADSVKNIQDQRKENEKVHDIDPIHIKEVDLVAKNGLVELKAQNEVRTIASIDLTMQEEVSSADEDKNTDVKTQTEISVVFKKAIVDSKSKKTLISRFQCLKCHKYYSSNYCLKRHIIKMHQAFAIENLRCNLCEETFVWPSLLKSHKCIRMNIPEMPFDDARPEIQFDNYGEFGQSGFDELMNITESEDYMNSVDFEVPEPIVELREYENGMINPNGICVNQQLTGNFGMPVNNSYKIVMQEVPIEF